MLYAWQGQAPRFEGEADWSGFVAPSADLIGPVWLGQGASVWFGAVIRADNHPIEVGPDGNVQENAVLHTDAGIPLTLGRGVTVGHQAMLHGCRIGRGTLIGMNAVVLDDATVGAGAIVAAGSVVREHFVVPDGMLVAGVPAKIIRPLTDAEKQALQESADRYVHYARSYDRP